MAWYAYFARNTRLGIVLILPGAAFLTFFIGCAPAPFERRHSGTENNRKAVQYFIDALALCSLYLMIRNPFSLLFMVPALAWLWIRERTGLGRILNGLALFTGGLVIYALLYFFGFVILRNDFAVLWYIQIKSGRPATQTLHRDR